MSEPILPAIDDESRPFWEGALLGELRMQRCSETGRLIFPPRPLSPWSPHAEPDWVTVCGRGTIWSYVVPHPPLLPFFAERAPYNVIAVALDEDPSVRLIGNLVTRKGGPIDEVDPRSIEIGAAVQVAFERVSAEVALPRWILV